MFFTPECLKLDSPANGGELDCLEENRKCHFICPDSYRLMKNPMEFGNESTSCLFENGYFQTIGNWSNPIPYCEKGLCDVPQL